MFQTLDLYAKGITYNDKAEATAWRLGWLWWTVWQFPASLEFSCFHLSRKGCAECSLWSRARELDRVSKQVFSFLQTHRISLSDCWFISNWGILTVIFVEFAYDLKLADRCIYTYIHILTMTFVGMLRIIPHTI